MSSINERSTNNWFNTWNDKLQFILTILGIVATLGSFGTYYILNSYINEINFSPDSINIHLIFSIGTNVFIFFISLFIVIMFGSFFSYDELNKIENHDTMLKLWISSSVILICLYLLYFLGASLFIPELWLDFYLLTLMLVLPLIEYYIIKTLTNKKDFIIVFWQMYYSFIIVGFLLLLLQNHHTGWIDIILIVIASLFIHSYPYLFLFLSEKSWTKYIFFSFILFSTILLIVAPSVLKDISIKFSRIGGINYKNIIIKDEECKDLNKYYKNKPCKNNQIKNLKGLWLQGNIYLFEDENKTRYKINKNNIIIENY